MRTPLALTNWKMAMTIRESLDYIEQFTALAGGLLDQVEVVICPPYTAIWAFHQHLFDRRIGIGGQNIARTDEWARTGEISAALLADAGCRWVMLGHWEVRRHAGDDDSIVNRKLHLALDAGLFPILFVGEAHNDDSRFSDALDRQLTHILAGCRADQVADMAFVYEPESAIGADRPICPARVEKGCAFVRGWLRTNWGNTASEKVRIIYGGSVAPDRAREMLAAPDVDGLGATRKGRNPATFVEIVRQIAQWKGA